ncbi:type II toxin-antitoxin system Phd/YefM family antitoxin [Dyadobacter chenwenxiniae]|uniref:Type II toxin-antitoxin system Phd/YefM family antitoxin n=1 Tax=Dyadobacter chenwenxiniae TaxID=2906456 RepID=A0A9X1PQX2_9BACT|nr:type II toxin-antitoxin system Phd/YefM family antitoxin [Dyadobacter chenwenxiniae]MCF0065777.1 type II toxin-antitoxin system Phd/YefM family antitoxin [Dyadobacter chenwenxiniae]UON84148.1 type II toxin-antitoxin system Phd/YefM family antitoxin [Dyadobacter chenwenxiniae]
MRIISAREFRGKQKDYLDLAEKERVIIHRGKNKKSVLLTPIDENTEHMGRDSVVAKTL